MRTNAVVRQIMYDANAKFTPQGKPGTADDLQGRSQDRRTSLDFHGQEFP
ncbi:MAG: hypothetical protein ACLQU1_35520 [Bryobacteraceae bacterium]